MKNVLMMALIFLLTGCSKDEPLIPLCNPGKYFPLEVGNYWVFENYRVHDDGLVEPRAGDSMFITSDTLMLGMRYFHLQGTFTVHPINRYLTSDNGQIRSASNFVFYECPRLIPSKKLYPIIDFDFPGTLSTTRLDTTIRVPAGDFHPVMLFEAHSMLDDSIWIVTYKCFYSKNIGMVKFTARNTSGDYENVSELVRYHVGD